MKTARVGNLVLTAMILGIVSLSLIVTSFVIESNTYYPQVSDWVAHPAEGTPPTEQEIDVQREIAAGVQDQTKAYFQILVLFVGMALAVSSGICLLSAAVAFYRRPKKGSVAELQASLALTLASMEVSAKQLGEEASEKEAQVNKLLDDIDHFRSVASLTKEQAAAVTRTLSKGAKLALVVGVAGLVATIGFGIWGAALALG